MSQNQELISFETFFEKLQSRARGIECIGFSGSEKAYLMSKIHRQLRTSILVIAPSTKDGERLVEDLVFFTGNTDMPILFFPPYNILPFKFLAYHNETAGHRISVLYRLMESSGPAIVVTTVDAILQKLFQSRNSIAMPNSSSRVKKSIETI
jgi:transcription-repair coupling factor (superfamily II helicase)